jgi:elongation factor Tu-like protein
VALLPPTPAPTQSVTTLIFLLSHLPLHRVQVSASLRLCDGCVVVVDCVEGVRVQTETVMRQVRRWQSHPSSHLACLLHVFRSMHTAWTLSSCAGFPDRLLPKACSPSCSSTSSTGVATAYLKTVPQHCFSTG